MQTPMHHQVALSKKQRGQTRQLGVTSLSTHDCQETASVGPTLAPCQPSLVLVHVPRLFLAPPGRVAWQHFGSYHVRKVQCSMRVLHAAPLQAPASVLPRYCTSFLHVFLCYPQHNSQPAATPNPTPQASSRRFQTGTIQRGGSSAAADRPTAPDRRQVC